MTGGIRVLVRQVTVEADGIHAYELVPAEGGSLPAFTAGAHVDVHLPSGTVRQYSLCGDPARSERYLIAVLREPHGRGGSAMMHRQVHAGSRLEISSPRNLFALREDDRPVLLLAGGIGITPLLSMIHRLVARGTDFRLVYCTRSPAVTPFADRLAPWAAAGLASVHHDGGDPQRRLDLTALLAHPEGRQLYYCGPPGFMTAVAEATGHWPAENVHCEHFAAAPRSVAADDAAFTVVLARSGAACPVGPGESIVTALARRGIAIPTSCEIGTCGTCRTRWLDGAPVHRDYVLTEAERREYLMPCCARSRGPVLSLDL